MAAKHEKLSALHEALADLMLDDIKWYRDNELPLPAADKAAIAKFLKDNAVTCDPADASDLEALREEFKASSNARRERSLRLVQASSEDLEAQYGVK